VTERPDDEAALDEEHRARMKVLQEEQRAKVRAANERRGVLVLNTGDGKGKSTAAFGMALRALGHGQRVAIVQFTKGSWKTGEQAMLRRLGVDLDVAGEGFTWDTQDRARDVERARRGWDIACERLRAREGDAPGYPLVILDELHIVLRYDYLPVDEIVAELGARHPMQNVVCTGRDAPEALVAIADTVTEMRLVKHAFEAGVRAQRGVEF
jgi:cob(I)alamin adenosyltransferase